MTHNCVTIIPVEYPRSDSSPLSACTLRGGPAAVGGDKRGDYATLDHRHGHHHHHHHHNSAPSPYAVSVPALATTNTTRRQLPTPTHHHHNQYHPHPATNASHHHLQQQQQQAVSHHHGHHNHVRQQQQCYQLPPLTTVGHSHDDTPRAGESCQRQQPGIIWCPRRLQLRHQTWLLQWLRLLSSAR
ncbi:hypothetical protein MTO96_037435 [Rhipicephalus appendiculatus]